MNLEALAVRRAEEQIDRPWSEIPANAVWRAPPAPRKPKRKGGRKPACTCGGCRRCKKNEAMRRLRAALPKFPKKLGPHMTLGRKCAKCRGPISDKNTSGRCKKCQGGWNHRMIGRVARRSQFYSHGGGI